MISERFDLRCPADGVYLHDYLLSRKTGQLRNTAAFFRRASSEANVLSYKPIYRSYAAVSEDNRNPFLSPVLIGGPHSRGFNFHAALFGDLGTTSSSSPINPASSPFSRRTQSRETAEASFVTSPPSAPSSIAAFGPERTPVSAENTPDTPQHQGPLASRTARPPAGGGNETDINRPEPLDFDFIGGARAFDDDNIASLTEVSASTSALPLQTRGDVVLEYKHYNNPPYATFGTRLTQSMVVCKKLRGHTGCINSIEYNDDASILITGSDDLKIKIFDTTSWKHLTTVTTQHAANIFSAIMIPNSCNNRLISCGLDGGICVSDIITNSSSLVHRYRFVMATKLMPLPEWGSGHVALCGFESGDIAFIDTRTKTLPHKAALFHSKGQVTHRIPINGIAAHPHNPNIFAFASDIPFAQLCDIRYLANTSIEQCKPRCAFSEVGVVTNRFRNRGIGGIGFSESGSRLLLNFKDSDLYGVEWSKMASEPSTQYMSTELQTQFTHVQTRSWPDPYAQALRDSLIGAGTFETPAAPTTTASVEVADDEDEESEEDLFLRSALALLGGSSSRDEAQTEEGGDIIDRLATVMRANRNNRPTGMTAAARRAELRNAAARNTDTPNEDEPIVCYKGRKNSVTMFKEATFLFEDQYVATGGDDGHVYFWEADTARLVHKIRCDRSIVNGVLYSSRLPTTLVACGIDSDAKVVKPFGNYLASTVTVRIPKDQAKKERAGSVAESESARNAPTTVLIGSTSASSDESHRSTINALLASHLDISIDGTPFRSSSARGLNEEHRNINTIRATARRLRGFFGTNLDADPLVESEEVDPLTRRFEADNDDDDENDNPSNSDSEFDEWIISNPEEAEENENDSAEELEGSIADDALAREGGDAEEQDQNEDLSDEAEEDDGEVEEIHDTMVPEEVEEAESVEEQESENDEFESEEWEPYEEEETLETERDSDSDTAFDDNDREGHAGLGWSASERARHLLHRYTSSEFAPKYFFEWPQIQFSLYNAHLLDKYVMQHLLNDQSNCNQDSQALLGVRDNIIPAIKFIIDDRNKLLRWLPSPPLRQETIAERIKSDYQQHIIPFEAKLREVCGNGEAIKSLISPSESSTAPTTDWTQHVDTVDLSRGFVPQGLFQNNFLHDFALFFQHFEKMYGSLSPILEEITSKQRFANELPESPRSIDPTSAVGSGVAKSASVDYLPLLSGKCPPDSKSKAQNSTTRDTDDCLTEAIPNNSFGAEEEQRPDLIVEKFLQNCKTILEEVIRLFAVLKHRDGLKIDLCWESVEYGALVNFGEATRGPSSVLNLPRLATIAERSNFWPSQKFEIQKIKSLLDLLDDYLKPAIRLPCCSSLRSARLLFFASLHAELKLYFSVMMARLPEVYEHLIFVRKLISHFEIPSLTRPLLAPRTNPTKELLEKLDSISATTTTLYASPFCDARFSSEHKLPFGTSTLACETLFLKCLLRDPHHEGLPEYFAPASVQRSVRQHLLRLGTDNNSRENMPEPDGDERLSCRDFFVESRSIVIKKLLQPFVDEGSLTNIFERPLL